MRLVKDMKGLSLIQSDYSKFKLLFVVVVLLFNGLFIRLGFCQGDNSTALSIKQAESIFIQRNLSVLSGKYGLERGAALELQARLFQNPEVLVDFNAIDPENKRAFHTGSSGQKVAGISQLIPTGGKRSAAISYFKKSQEADQLDFQDLLRNLRFEMVTSFYTLHEQNRIETRTKRQLALLDTIIRSYDDQSIKGNLPIKESIRLKSVWINLNAGLTEISNIKIANQERLRILLQEDNEIRPLVSQAEFDLFRPKYSLDSLIKLALSNRPDVQRARMEVELAEMQIRLQRKLAIPDVNLSATYDQRGGAFQNQINLGASMPLPVWNRNQGNIKLAETEAKIAKTQLELKEKTVREEVVSSFRNLERSLEQYQKVTALFSNDFEVVFRGLSQNFRKQNISLIEFVDFFESYTQSEGEIERIKSQLAIAAARINYATSTAIY